MLLFACYLLMEKKSFLLKARLDMEKAARENGDDSSGDNNPNNSESQAKISTLAKFDDAVRTYINCE